MFHIAWKDRYNINYKDIDDQHRRLLAILNELADMQGGPAETGQVAEIIHRLCEYALTHFATEERYMEAAGYAGLPQHQIEHAYFIQQLLSLNHTYDPADPKLVPAAFDFVKDWYLRHILRSDMEYAACLKAFRGQARIKGLLVKLSQVLCLVDERAFHLACASSPPDASKPDLASLAGQYGEGVIDTATFLTHLGEWPAPPSGTSWVASYAQVFTPIPPALSLLEKLKAQYKLSLLADTTPLRLEQGLEPLGILPLFDTVVLAWPASKKEEGCYQEALNGLGLQAEECIYVDAQPSNVRSANRHLFQAIAAPTFEALQANLRRLGVAPSEAD